LRFDVEDPNPIGWPERAYWAFLAESEVSPDSVWGLIWGPDIPESQEVIPGSPLAPEDLSGTVPPLSWGRQDQRWRDFVRAVYAEIGEVPEYDEYKIETERFRTGPDHEQERTLSLNYATGEDLEFIDYLEDQTDSELEPEPDSYDDFVAELRSISGLTKAETEVIRWVVSGNTMMGVDYSERLAEALDSSPGSVRVLWLKARNKLREHWAGDPD
jgi:DNA-binding CsgD family transcriptional regulator